MRMIKGIKNLFNKRQSVLGERSEWIPFSNNFPPSRATRLATVGRCLRLYSDFLTQLPLLADGSNNHYLIDLLNKPNVFDSRKTFFEKLTYELLLNGNFICAIDYDSTGRVTSLLPYRSGQIYAYSRSGEYGDPVSINKYGYFYRDFKGRVYMPDEIFHLKDVMFSSVDNLNGLSRVYLYELAFQSSSAVNNVQFSLSQSGLRPPLLLSGLPEDNNESIKDVREVVKEFFERGQSSQAGGVLTLPSGYDIKTMMVSNPEKALEFLTSKSDLDISRIFAVPIEFLSRSDGNNQAGSNHLKEAHRFFIKTSLNSFLKGIADKLSELASDGSEFKFNIQPIKSSDLREEAQALQQLVAGGILTSQEAKLRLS